MKLGLGTVQFGLDYGVSNSSGRTPEAEVRDILRIADMAGIQVIDTASGYGTSEEVLGLCAPPGEQFLFVTKTLSFGGRPVDGASAASLIETFHGSLRKLRRKAVYGLLAHSAGDLLASGAEELVAAMQELKRRGLVQKIGVSAYNAAQIDAIMDRHRIDLIQVPLSVFDQRLLMSGHLKVLKQAGVEVHVRSVFLQGLLVMPPAELPAYFAPIRGHLERYREHLAQAGFSPTGAALDFALGVADVDHVILGVNSRLQLQEILREFSDGGRADWGRFAIGDPAMLDPSQWRLA